MAQTGEAASGKNKPVVKSPHRKRHFRLILMLSILIILTVVAEIYASTVLFSRTTLEYRSEIISKSARLASEQIDGDKIDDWLENGADEEYQSTARMLQSILNNTPYLQYLYVYQIKPEGCYVVFDLETMEEELEKYDEVPDVDSEALGELIDFDESFSEYIPALLKGEEIGIVESNDTYGWLLTKYEPIRDRDGNCVAYVGVDISMIGVSDNNKEFMIWVAGIGAVLLLGVIIVGFAMSANAQRADEYDEFVTRQKSIGILFDQTSTALANAIDAKDKYTHGHSVRVAEYSRKIAELAGKNDEECNDIYYAALLHDVGKIGISEAIITKDGKLTDEEYETIKKHSELGSQVLKSITEYPNLSTVARYHHERYDGTGYPDGLKGEEIPEIARIVAVADAYDAMTSNRSYRDAIPQSVVREQFIMNSGTQFDPRFANLMLRLIDIDTGYMMKEQSAEREASLKDELRTGEYRENVSRGILINEYMTYITFKVSADNAKNTPKPSFIFFDSLDGDYHKDPGKIKDRLYHEYCEISSDGNIMSSAGIRNSETRTVRADDLSLQPGEYKLQLVKVKDHALIVLSERGRSVEITLALPDSTSYMYIAFTGEHCVISDMTMSRSDRKVEKDRIPRIAEEISFITAPAGDIPNVQVDGYCTDYSAGIPLKNGFTVSFHSKSLPTARLIWHCPYCALFSSDDGLVTGENYKEYLLLRIDGETWTPIEEADNDLKVDKKNFTGWDNWKQLNRDGFDCRITFKREGDVITATTENAGISIVSKTTLKVPVEDLYVAVTGDQCAITGIKVRR